MREFILRARTAKTGDFDINDLPSAGRMDIVCNSVSNALNIANKLREDTVMHVVLEGSPEPPKIISFHGDSIKGMLWDEKSIAEHIRNALLKSKGQSMKKEISKGHCHSVPGPSTLKVAEGLFVEKKSFEALVKEKVKEGKQVVYLHQDGKDIRETELKKDIVVVFGDYIGMPRATEGLLDRLGAERISLGPKMLFAAHCILIVHNELDRRFG
ncbi:MAG: tRNA (pseudouridine(54)-N(1))-methyltransferase TrmY [Candidatus Nanoarchaeia archaeon]|nr:tRNA (pseudouridine(54)-N(1))-methyltransferase TrmY [Candidatus Nanoarchaeia archaeon]